MLLTLWGSDVISSFTALLTSMEVELWCFEQVDAFVAI